ncbi:PepSY-associated TM helix domain-containing protein [Caldimonas brevitalea]|uniref:Iron-regulated membrane protein n=1 Tax=Caldimonas brevitalea TaxID=413882 RepID=A0A0G3BVS7_9BURK|nr:PepSY-associated TM helix domain-containing protein [Caldimonas brevitalea]AKJ32133.1 hypothetical protein AAW51_5442 [Caldimonas brevitalea]
MSAVINRQPPPAMNRQTWVLMHRYAGLAIAGFLLIAGLTGSLLAFLDELDIALVPELRLAPERPGAAPLDPLVLRERVERSLPAARIDYHALHRPAGESARLYVNRMEGPPGQQTPVLYEVFADPYTGEVLGERRWGAWVLDRAHLMPLIYNLHYALSLPYPWGMWLFGAISLVWLLDGFVGFYLTLPRGRQRFFSRWQPSWRVKWAGSAYRLNFDLHRAASLWVWALLLLFALSSICLNLGHEVYMPVLKRIVPTVDVHERLPNLATPLETPALDWHQARERGRALMAEHARRDGFELVHEDSLMLERDHGAWRYAVRSSHDFASDHGRTAVYFSAATPEAEEIAFEHPTVAPGNTFTSWLMALHMGKVFGLPWRLLIVVLGLVVAMLSVTGVVIWLKKRRARRAAQRAGAADAGTGPGEREQTAHQLA